MLYYAARIAAAADGEVDDALRSEAAPPRAVGRSCTEGDRPLPLVNDSRCPRCSLQPICLPDEINAARSVASESPRKLWPPRDDGIHRRRQKEPERCSRGLFQSPRPTAGLFQELPPSPASESLSLLGSVQISTQAAADALHGTRNRPGRLSFRCRPPSWRCSIRSTPSSPTRGAIRSTVATIPPRLSSLPGPSSPAQDPRHQRTLLMRKSRHPSGSCLGAPSHIAEAQFPAEVRPADRQSPVDMRGRLPPSTSEHFGGPQPGAISVRSSTSSAARRASSAGSQ